MKSTSVIIRTDRFLAEWLEGSDSDPPPGRDFADALLKCLLGAGATSRVVKMTDDSWEHSDWYFGVGWSGHQYNIYITCGVGEVAPPAWAVTVTKCLGCLTAAFGRRERRFEVDDSFLKLVAECLAKVASVNSVEWVTEDEAIDSI